MSFYPEKHVLYNKSPLRRGSSRTARVATMDIFVDTKGGSRTAPTRSVYFKTAKLRILLSELLDIQIRSQHVGDSCGESLEVIGVCVEIKGGIVFILFIENE